MSIVSADTFLKCKWSENENACLARAVEKALKAMKSGKY